MNEFVVLRPKKPSLSADLRTDTLYLVLALRGLLRAGIVACTMMRYHRLGGLRMKTSDS